MFVELSTVQSLETMSKLPPSFVEAGFRETENQCYVSPIFDEALEVRPKSLIVTDNVQDKKEGNQFYRKVRPLSFTTVLADDG